RGPGGENVRSVSDRPLHRRDRAPGDFEDASGRDGGGLLEKRPAEEVVFHPLRRRHATGTRRRDSPVGRDAGFATGDTTEGLVNAQALDRELLKLSLSPIAAYLDDPEVTDILVYGSRHVYVRRRGSGFEGVGA